MRILRKMIIYLVVLGLLGLLTVIGIDAWVSRSAKPYIVEEVPNDYAVALVLGTSPKTSDGRTNLFFKYRLDAAAKLYREGHIKHFVLSGDNRTEQYDEPTQMRKALIERGVPQSAITLDYAGFRTLDSIVRTRSVFALDKVLIISQAFHNERALFIAQVKGINALAFNAESVPQSYAPKTYLREYLARCKAVLDLYILGTEPHFPGPKEPLEI
ncbi:MAG: ElyC/SanA/YdcF family protein [Bacteroidota bacterium]